MKREAQGEWWYGASTMEEIAGARDGEVSINWDCAEGNVQRKREGCALGTRQRGGG